MPTQKRVILRIKINSRLVIFKVGDFCNLKSNEPDNYTPYNMSQKRNRSFSAAIAIRKYIIALDKQIHPKAIKGTNNKKDEGERSKSNLKWTEIVMAIFTIILTAGTLLLFREASHQNREIKNEFGVANVPYLQIGDVKDTPRLGQPFSFNYQIDNLGKAPAKIWWGYFKMEIKPIRLLYGLSPHPDSADFIVDSGNNLINSYSLNGQPYFGRIQFVAHSDTSLINKITEHKLAVVFYGKVTYQDLISMQERIYVFKIFVNSIPRPIMFMNENYPFIEGNNYPFTEVWKEHKPTYFNVYQ